MGHLPAKVKLRHLCLLGCHRTKEDAVNDIFTDLRTAHMDLSIGVPAINRWVKLFKPTAFWLVSVVLGVVMCAFGRISESLEEVSETTVLSVDELIGIGEDTTYQNKRRMRFKKAYKWMRAPFTALRTLVGVVLLGPIVNLLGSFFTGAKFDQPSSEGMLDMIIHSRNPVIKVVQRYLDVLADDTHVFWTLPRCLGGWTERTLRTCATLTLIITSSLWFRLIRVWELWPWRLIYLFWPGYSADERHQVNQEFKKARLCCVDMGFTGRLKQISGADENLSANQEVHDLVMETFKCTPCHNVANEDRFARANMANTASHGKVGNQATMACRHVLCESKVWHRISMERFGWRT